MDPVAIDQVIHRGKKDVAIFSHQFSPKGRAGGFHLLRY